MRCADFEGQRYCLERRLDRPQPEAEVRRPDRHARPAPSPRVPRRTAETTGDLDALGRPRSAAAALDPAARAEAERRELTEAARSVAKVWLLRHEIEGVALPERLPRRAPGGPRHRSGTARPDARPKSHADYPDAGHGPPRRKEVAEQVRTYWCGPTTMQMIAWGWQHESRTPEATGRAGSAPPPRAARSPTWCGSSTARPASTGKDRAGPYIVLDISELELLQVVLLQMRHIVDYRAPLVLHPVLLKKFYPYLDDDASGHFQVGRGYDKRGKKPARSATSSRGTSSASTPPSPTSAASSGAAPTRATAPTRPTSSRTSGSDASRPRGGLAARRPRADRSRAARRTTSHARIRARRPAHSTERARRTAASSTAPPTARRRAGTADDPAAGRGDGAPLDWSPVPGSVDDTVTVSGRWTLTYPAASDRGRAGRAETGDVRAPNRYRITDALIDGEYAVVVAAGRARPSRTSRP